MSASLEELERLGVVPVVELDDAEAAVELADALAAGGITAAEITFRTAAPSGTATRDDADRADGAR